MNNRVVGSVYERLAVNYLRKQKYKILETNFSTKVGEIDIIAMDKATLVFVEVKYRTSDVYGTGAMAVDSQKQRKIVQTSKLYIVKNKLTNVTVRYDVVEIMNSQLSHIIDAFRC